MEDVTQRFTAIYNEHYPKVLAYLLTRVDRQVAEDLAAETFMVAWRRLDRVPTSPLPWLLGVARNVLREQRRATGRRAALEGRVSALSGPADRSGRDVADEVVETSQLRRALARLPERDREALTLVAWLDLSPKDAAEVAGCAPATFLMRLHRAKRRLERVLRGQGVAPAPNPDRSPNRDEPVSSVSVEEPA